MSCPGLRRRCRVRHPHHRDRPRSHVLPPGVGRCPNVDPLRVVEAVTAGVALLAAGSIMFARARSVAHHGGRNVARRGHRPRQRAWAVEGRGARHVRRPGGARAAQDHGARHGPKRPSSPKAAPYVLRDVEAPPAERKRFPTALSGRLRLSRRNGVQDFPQSCRRSCPVPERVFGVITITTSLMNSRARSAHAEPDAQPPPSPIQPAPTGQKGIVR